MFGKKVFVLLLAFFLVGPFLLARSDEPPRVLPPEDAKITASREAVDGQIDAVAPRLLELSDWMYYNPEPGFLEFEASKKLAEELEKHGFEVEFGVPGLPPDFDHKKIVGGLPADYSGPPGLPTAFKAKYKGKDEHPVIGYVLEYDALRGNPPFHGCQHNMQGPAGIGAAIGLAKVMDEKGIPGSVWVIGAPAEEVGPTPKAAMANAGYFDGIDFVFRSHGTARETLRYPEGFSARHIRSMKYTFHGKSAHAQRAYQGRSALDAVFYLFHAIDLMREHSEPQFRFHGIVSDGGVAPNIVPITASATIWVRHLIDETPTGSMTPREAREMIDKKVEELDDMANGAALSTGTTVEIDHYSECQPGVSVGTLNDIVFQYAVDYGGINIGERQVPRHWEETGFATLVVPGGHVTIGTEGIPEVAGHSQENADITITEAGHKNLVLTAKVMAASGLRLLMEPELREKAKAEHARLVEEYNK